MRASKSGRVVLDSRGGEDLAPTRGVERVHFVGRAGQGADLAGTPEAPERWEGGGSPTGGPFLLVLRGLSINEIYGDSLDIKFLDVREAGDGAGGVVVVYGARFAKIRSVEEFMESREDFGGLKGRHIEEAAPDFSRREAAGREARYDPEIIGATFKGAPEVGISYCGGCNNGAGGEDNFVAKDVGAD